MLYELYPSVLIWELLWQRALSSEFLCCVTILPSFILIFDKAIEKTSHRDILPEFTKTSKFIVKHFGAFAVAFLVLLVPALYGYTHYDIYYNLDSTLPKYLDSIVANTKLSEEYNMNCTHMLLVDADMKSKDAIEMTEKNGKGGRRQLCIGIGFTYWTVNSAGDNSRRGHFDS